MNIYLVNLRKYNKRERDYGSWVDLTQDRKDVEEQVRLVIGKDDYEIHDFETNLEINIKVDTSIETLLDLVEALEFVDYPESVVNNLLEQYKNKSLDKAVTDIEYGEIDYYENVETKEELGRALAEDIKLTETGRIYLNYADFGADAVLEGWYIGCGAAVYIHY